MVGIYSDDGSATPAVARVAQDAVYVGTVAAAVSTAGYRVTETFVEGPEVFDHPDHVIRVDLGGPTADLVWSGDKGWVAIVHPYPSAAASVDLSRRLTDQTDASSHMVVRMARILMDEAVDRWGNTPQPVPPTLTWTFFGHWEDDRIVVDCAVPGTVEDVRDDDGRWDQGLWAASASGTTFEQARAAAIAEYAPDQATPDRTVEDLPVDVLTLDDLKAMSARDEVAGA